jgi:CTP synthase
MDEWRKFVEKTKKEDRPVVKIGIVGKYFDTGDYVLSDAYLSIIEALKFSGAELGVKPQITWLNAKDYERGADVEQLSDYDGIFVPGRLRRDRHRREAEGHPVLHANIRFRTSASATACSSWSLNTRATCSDLKARIPWKSILRRRIRSSPSWMRRRNISLKGNYGGTMRLGSYMRKIKQEL